jgi:hypothetical protein
MIGHIGTIFILESLPKGDMKTGSEIFYDTLEKHYKYYPDIKDKLSLRFFSIDNRTEFFDAINYIRHNLAGLKLGVIIHFEMHGGKNVGLQLANGEIVDWTELTEFLTYSNLTTCNKVYLCMATCYGRWIYKAVDIKQTSPFCGYLSASKELKPNEILTDYKTLYESLLQNHNLILSFEELQKQNPKSDFYYKDTDAVFNELMDYVFSNPTVKKELLEGSKKDLEQTGIKDTYSDSEINEILEKVQSDYRKHHYPKFVLKNCS